MPLRRKGHRYAVVIWCKRLEKKKPLGVGSHRRILYAPGTYVAQETKEQLVADISEDRYPTRCEVELHQLWKRAWTILNPCYVVGRC